MNERWRNAEETQTHGSSAYNEGLRSADDRGLGLEEKLSNQADSGTECFGLRLCGLRGCPSSSSCLLSPDSAGLIHGGKVSESGVFKVLDLIPIGSPSG